MTKIPVPTRTIIIKGIDPIGISGVGKFFIKSKLPGNDHTVSKIENPANIIMSIIMMKIIMPSLDRFTSCCLNLLIVYLFHLKRLLISSNRPIEYRNTKKINTGDKYFKNIFHTLPSSG